MPVTTFKARLSAPAGEAYAWLTRPGAFERGMPPWSRHELLDSRGDPAGRHEVTLRQHDGLLGARWRLVSTADPTTRTVRTEVAEGPLLPLVRTVHVEPDGDGCYLEERSEWESGPAGLGGFLPRVSVPALLRRVWRFRHQRVADDLARHRSAGVGPLHLALIGASGLVGAHLAPYLTAGGHRVTRLVRGTPAPGEATWDPAAGRLDPAALEGVDAVVHLSGEPVLDRWTPAKRARIRESRVGSTRLVAETLARLERPPRVLIAASAVGIYGDRGDTPCTELSAPGRGFLSEVCQAWEAATSPASAAGIRVVNLRIGVVLAARGGALGTMLPAFSAGVGGAVGSGRQMVSWVGVDDLCGMVTFLLGHELVGPVNATAPEPVTNQELTRTLARILDRPALVHVPAPMIRVLFGEMGEEVLLAGVAAPPRALLAAGFRFAQPDLEAALRGETGRYGDA